jgi:hypothetical protein
VDYHLPRPTNLFPLTRLFAWPLSWVFLRTPITPNQITALSLVAGLAGAGLFAVGTWEASMWGAMLFSLCYTLDNCDGDIARARNMTSDSGARFDDVVDWLADSAFFVGLGVGTWVATDQVFWLWLGLAASTGATIDFVVDINRVPRWKKLWGKTVAEVPPEEASEEAGPKSNGFSAQLMYIGHSLSRADFCFIVLGLTIFDVTWVLLPLAAIGAQVYWIVDLFRRDR